MKTSRCYVTAGILNKLRQYVKNTSKDTIRISASQLKTEIGSSASRGKIRLVLKELEEKGFISSVLIGRELEYTINVDRIQYVNSPEIVKDYSAKLAYTFMKYRYYLAEEHHEEKLKSWGAVFSSMLSDGIHIESIRHIIGHLVATKNISVETPEMLRDSYDTLYTVSYSVTSNRKSNRSLWKAFNHSPLKLKDNASIEPNTKIPLVETPYAVLSIDEKWKYAQQWVAKHKKALHRWHFSQSYGVTDVDYEDYVNQMYTVIIDEMNRGRFNIDTGDNKLTNCRLIFKMRSYMTKKRTIMWVKTKEERTSEKAIDRLLLKGKDTSEELSKQYVQLITQFSDIENKGDTPYDFLETYVSDNYKESNDSIYLDKNSEFLEYLKDKLTTVNENYPYFYQIMSYTYGLDGVKLTYRELEQRYGITHSTIQGHVKYLLECMKNDKEVEPFHKATSLSPPG